MDNEAGMWAAVEATPRAVQASWDAIGAHSQGIVLLERQEERGEGGSKNPVARMPFGLMQKRGDSGGEIGMWDAAEDRRIGVSDEDMWAGLAWDPVVMSGNSVGGNHLLPVGGGGGGAGSVLPDAQESREKEKNQSRASGTTSKFDWRGDEAELMKDPRIMEELSKLRLIEEDRNSLVDQVMRIKKQLELSKADRMRSQQETEAAHRRMDLLTRDEDDRTKSDKDRLSELQSRIDQLSTQLDSAKARSRSHAPDVVESLRQRVDSAESELKRHAEERGDHEQAIIKQIALTLKVLQLQKECGERLTRRQKQMEAVLDQSLDIVSKERDGVGTRMGIENKASQSLDAFYSDEGKRMRELSLIKAEAHQLLRKCKGKAHRLLVLEGGVVQSAQEAEYECRMHSQIMMEFDDTQQVWSERARSERGVQGENRNGGSDMRYRNRAGMPHWEKLQIEYGSSPEIEYGSPGKAARW